MLLSLHEDVRVRCKVASEELMSERHLRRHLSVFPLKCSDSRLLEQQFAFKLLYVSQRSAALVVLARQDCSDCVLCSLEPASRDQAAKVIMVKRRA